MKARQEEFGISFCINNEGQYNVIGYSEDYDICTGKQSMKVGDKEFRCKAFLNKSVETICDRHKFEQNLF
jgi:hypothetical protein